ncbi:EAL domain-containing protein [Sphingomonas sp. PB2P19]|uniref:sensor domain-containing protein n=1 Tax=Sphingomonas rhamnosi TaxID=3096156 RepID=UPI002FC9685E
MALTTGGSDFSVFFESSPAPALMLDCDLTILACNAAYERVAHVDRATMVGRPVFDVFPGSDVQQANRLRESYDRVLKSRKPDDIAHLQFATALPESPGLHERYWTISNSPIIQTDGTLCGILSCPADITELVRLRQGALYDEDAEVEPGAQERLQRWTRTVHNVLESEKERLRQLFQSTPSFIAVLQGPHHVFELANDAYYQLVGHREIIGHRVADVLPEIVAQGFIEKLDRVFLTGVPFNARALPLEIQRSAGGELEQCYIDLIYQPIVDNHGKVTGIFAQGNDVTDAHKLAQDVAYQASHDFLTGLCNRREFCRQIPDIDEPGSHALLYMDIDHLKIVNDRCGHAAGDTLLLQVADALRSQCDDEHDLLARLGGDEFALVRRNCSAEAALALATRLCAAVKDISFIERGKRYGVTLSVGVAMFGEAERPSFETTLGMADAACFLAKEKGRNRVQMSSASDEDVALQRQEMDNVTRLKEALREDRVILYAQQIVGLRTDDETRDVSYEVLARLCEPDGTIVAPSGFIPAAERYGMIEELDRHIVCKTFAHLQGKVGERNDDIRYFVNISGLTLSAHGFVAFIDEALKRCPAVGPSQICFEVTETAALSNVQRTAEAMRRLVEIGFTFALDDFGSGMASFAYLSQLPVQFVKIDGDFIRAMRDQPSAEIIVDAVARLGRAMNIRTIAESVEYEELIPRLKSLGLDYAQGYALHLPEPIDEVTFYPVGRRSETSRVTRPAP